MRAPTGGVSSSVWTSVNSRQHDRTWLSPRPTAAQLDLATRLFESLRNGSIGAPGVTRDTYGAGENFAHGLMRDHALRLGLDSATDAAANTYMTLPGRDRAAPRGGDPDLLRQGYRHLDPRTVRAFLEGHIEQAPSLVEAGLPLAVCTDIPGNFRYPNAQIARWLAENACAGALVEAEPVCKAGSRALALSPSCR